MQEMTILGTGSFVPEHILTNDDMTQYVDTSDEWIRTRTGIVNRHFQDNGSVLEMSVAASRQAIERSGIAKDQIGAVIVATFTSEYATPSIASLLQRELDLPANIISFDLNAACSGFIYALMAGAALLTEGRYALIVGAEAVSSVLDMSDRNTCVLFGDGAGACVIGKGHKALYQVAGCQGDDEVLVAKRNDYLHMEGRQVFKFAVKTLERTLNDLVEQAGLSVEELDYVISHQANYRIIKHVYEKMKIPAEKFYMNLQEFGNTSAASIPLALAEMDQKGLLQNGMKIAMIGFGSGLTYGGVLLEWGK